MTINEKLMPLNEKLVLLNKKIVLLSHLLMPRNEKFVTISHLKLLFNKKSACLRLTIKIKLVVVTTNHSPTLSNIHTNLKGIKTH